MTGITMTRFTDDDLYSRGIDTLLTTWRDYARCAPGASVERLPGLSAAIFPVLPERDVYNNVVIDRHVPSHGLARVIDGMEQRYAAAGIDRYSAWVHDSETELARALEARGYRLDETNRAMGMDLAGLAPPTASHDLVPMTWDTYVDVFELPAELLRRTDQRCRLRLVGARIDGQLVASAAAFDHRTDCGIFNVGTLEASRRRGLGAAVTARQLHDARRRGCRTASLQATPMAERLYAALGFRDLGQILEYVPTADR